MAKILALTARLPYPPREGHQLRSWHVLRALARRHEVTLLSLLRTDDAPQECAPLRAMLRKLELFPIPAQSSHLSLGWTLARGLFGRHPFVAEKCAPAALRRRVAELAADADVVHADLLPMMHCIGKQVDRPIVLNEQNVEYRLLRQRAAIAPQWQRPLFYGQARKLARFERAACSRASRVLACSREDAAHLALLAPRTPIHLVPNGADVAGIHPALRPPAHPARIVFVGGMNWFPNRDGVQWFLAEIFPRILAARPDAEFVLVGKPEGLRVPDALRAHVRLAGFVPDLDAPMHDAAICVVPLRSGSGTRLKVLEAMAYAKPIVTTTIGAQGIELVPDSEAMFADSAEAFAAGVLELIDNPARALRLGHAARAKAQARYDWEAIGRDVRAIYDELLSAKGSRRENDTLPRRTVRAAPVPS